VTRPLKQSFLCEPLADLTRQLLFSPPEKRREQLLRAERLHDEIEAEVTYPLDFLVYRITRYRRGGADNDLLLVGQAALPDLRLLIDALSRSVEVSADDGMVETVEQLAARLGVSTKTVTRWRKAGLRWRWVSVEGRKQKKVGFTAEAVARFMAAAGRGVEEAAGLSRMSEEVRAQVIERAKALAAAEGVSLNQVATQLAGETNRAVETIRQLLIRHDQEHGEEAIFPNQRGPLSARDRRLIARAYRAGVSVGKMAERFGRTRVTIYRAINERRAAAARRLRLTYVASRTFGREDADEVILRAVEAQEPESARGVAAGAAADLPGPLAELYSQRALEAKQQRSLFIRFNYLKYKAQKIRQGLDRYAPRAKDLDEFEGCVRRAREIQNMLVKANLPVVLSIVRRHMVGEKEASPQRLLELLDVGNAMLLEAVESYDATRSGSFESLLTNRVMQELARGAARAQGERPQAHRRLSPQAIVRRMMQRAGETGVELPAVDEGRA
jgi:transposase